MRPFRPACGTVSKAQLLTLPEIIRIIAPGVVTTQLSHPPPASSSATDVLGSSESRLATAQPPEPPPTTTKSNVSVTRAPWILSRRAHWPVCWFQGWAFVQILARGADCVGFRDEFSHFGRHKILKSRLPALSKADARWYIPPATPRVFAKGCLLRKPPDGIDRRALRGGQIRFGIRFLRGRARLYRGVE